MPAQAYRGMISLIIDAYPICVKGMKTTRYARAFALLSGLLPLTSCSAPSPVATLPRFTEEDAADFVARYYSDETSYMLKPVMMDGPYLSILHRASLLNLAKQQPRHGLEPAVPNYPFFGLVGG